MGGHEVRFVTSEEQADVGDLAGGSETRRGPAELWERFDAAVGNLNHAITGTNVTVVARAFAELASAAGALADAVEAEDRELAAGQLRSQAV